MEKTLAMKVLEGKKVAYEVVMYPDSERDALLVSQALAVPPGQVFKTLVVTRPSGKPLLAMLPADRQLDLKQLAQAVGEKKLKMAAHQEAEALTGLQVGGISALALLHRPFAIYLDTAAREYEQIYISAGKRGINLKVGVLDLVKVTGARWVGRGAVVVVTAGDCTACDSFMVDHQVQQTASHPKYIYDHAASIQTNT